MPVLAAATLVASPARGEADHSGRLLAETLHGTRTVDIVFFGDSNAAYPYGYGMTNGLLTAMLERGGVQYATPLYAMHNGNSAIGQSRATVVGGSLDPVGPRNYAPAHDAEPTDGRNALPIRSQIAIPGQPPLLEGRAPARTQQRFTRGLGKLKPFGQGLQNGTDHANGTWIDPGVWFGNGGHRIEVWPVRTPLAFEPADPAVYTVWYAAEMTGGSMRPWVQDMDPATGDYSYSRQMFADTRGELGRLVWKLPGTSVSPYGYRVFAYHDATPALGVHGPVALWWHSVHRHKVGFSMNQLSYFGGRSLSDLAIDIEQSAPGYLSRAVQAIRLRAMDVYDTQQALRGSGACEPDDMLGAAPSGSLHGAAPRVPSRPAIVFWYEGGINDIVSDYGSTTLIETPAMAAAAVERMAVALHGVARAQGYAPEEIGVVFQSSHQPFPVDPITDKRLAFREIAANPSAEVPPWTYVDSERVAPFEMLRQSRVFDELGPAHLQLRGYDLLMSRGLDAVLGRPFRPVSEEAADIVRPEDPLGPGSGTPCKADIVEDALVDAADIAALLLAWGSTGPDVSADVNGDGLVDAADLAAVLLAWGRCPD